MAHRSFSCPADVRQARHHLPAFFEFDSELSESVGLAFRKIRPEQQSAETQNVTIVWRIGNTMNS